MLRDELRFLQATLMMAMQNREIKRQIQSLKSLMDKVNYSSVNDIELQSHWARYICILSAGLLENAIYEIYGDFARRVSAQPVANFTTHTLKSVYNPNADKLTQIARSFKPEWASELENFLDSEGRKEALNSIVTVSASHVVMGF